MAFLAAKLASGVFQCDFASDQRFGAKTAGIS